MMIPIAMVNLKPRGGVVCKDARANEADILTASSPYQMLCGCMSIVVVPEYVSSFGPPSQLCVSLVNVTTFLALCYKHLACN